MRGVFLLVIAAVVLTGAIAAVYLAVTARQADEGWTGTADDALNRGLSTSHRVNSEASLVGVGAELVNMSPLTLEVDEPIRISGTAEDSGVHMLNAQLTEVSSDIAELPDAVPDELTMVPPQERVTVAATFEIDCTRWVARGDWPSNANKVTINLVGFDEPATFAFSALFGDEVGLRIQEMCAAEQTAWQSP